MRTLHEYFAFVVAAANLGVGIWGVVTYRRKKPATRNYWIALGVAWATIYVQGALGLALFNRPDHPRPSFKHHFYGFLFVIITLAVFPIRGEHPRRTHLVFSVATLFIGIVAIRAIVSGYAL
jgi:hypothetical protein